MSICPTKCTVRVIQDEENPQVEIIVNSPFGGGIVLPAEEVSPEFWREIAEDKNVEMDEDTREVIQKMKEVFVWHDRRRI